MFGAVITGDIVKSRRISDRERLTRVIKNYIQHTETRQWVIIKRFEIFRGDSFQFEVGNPEKAVELAILLRLLPDLSLNGKRDLKISIAFGELDEKAPSIGEAMDQAYILSGQGLDHLEKGKQRLFVRWPIHEKSMTLLTDVIDDMLQSWTTRQSEVAYHYLQHKGKNLKDIAVNLDVQVSTISRSVTSTKVEKIYRFIKLSENLLLEARQKK